jgi:hypothetical protein
MNDVANANNLNDIEVTHIHTSGAGKYMTNPRFRYCFSTFLPFPIGFVTWRSGVNFAVKMRWEAWIVGIGLWSSRAAPMGIDCLNDENVDFTFKIAFNHAVSPEYGRYCFRILLFDVCSILLLSPQPLPSLRLLHLRMLATNSRCVRFKANPVWCSLWYQDTEPVLWCQRARARQLGLR